MRRLCHFGLILAGFTALTALLFAPVLDHLSTALLGPPEDNLNDFWNSWYAAVGVQGGRFFFTNLIRFPEGVSLIYQSFAYPQVAAVWVLSSLFGRDLSTLTLLQNLTILASFPLGAAGAYYLCRHLGGGELGGALGGFIFAFNPWHVEQAMHHAHVASIEFLPAFVLAYLLAHERKSIPWLGVAAMLYALSALCCWYFLFYGFYFLVFDALVRVWREHKLAGCDWRWILGAPPACIVAAVVLLSPLLMPMIAHGSANAYKPGSNIYVADLLGYISFPPTHLWAAWGTDAYRSFTGNIWEASVYLGLVNLALVLYAFLTVKSPAQKNLLYALGGVLVFMVFASGDALHERGNILPVHMPAIILSGLPFFSNVRTPARAMVFGYMFLGIIVALAIARLGKARAGHWLAGAAAVLIVLDFYPAHLVTTPLSCAPQLSVLRHDPDKGFGVLDLPVSYEQEDYYMAQQACHGRPIVEGVIARQLQPTLGDRVDLEDIAVQRRALRQAHVKYILLHRPDPDMDHDQAAAYSSAYSVVSQSPALTILKVY